MKKIFKFLVGLLCSAAVLVILFYAYLFITAWL